MAALALAPPNVIGGPVLGASSILFGRRWRSSSLMAVGQQEPGGAPSSRRAHHVHVRRPPNLASLAPAHASAHSTSCLLTFGARPNAHFVW